MTNGDAKRSAQSGRISHQGCAQGNFTQTMENAVRVTEQLKTEIRNTYNIKANILGPTACAMAMQIELTEQRNNLKGERHPSQGGAAIPSAQRKEVTKLWTKHLRRCSCSMAKVSTIRVHLIIFKLFPTCSATWGTPQHRHCRCLREIKVKHPVTNAWDRYRDWTNRASGQRARL